MGPTFALAILMWMFTWGYAMTGSGVQLIGHCKRSTLDELLGRPGKDASGRVCIEGLATPISAAGGYSAANPGLGSLIPVIGCAKLRLQTRLGVTLAPRAMRSFLKARADAEKAGVGIAVSSSYRSCADQAAACAHTTGPCATPGTSNHQRGLAVDVSDWQAAGPYLVAHGWCHPFPQSDAEHFSYGTCG